jgi:nitrite reductase/ring-hydroxylating ferredoxin subunit
MAKIVVGKTDDIGEGKLTHVQAGGKEVLVANVKGNYYAMGNICTHAGAELHEGECHYRQSGMVSSEIKTRGVFQS